MNHFIRRFVFLAIVFLTATHSARARADGDAAPSPCYAPFWIRFDGAPVAASLQDAVHWAMSTVMQSDSLPAQLYRLPGPDHHDVVFADSTWTGGTFAPGGIADAILSGWWFALGREVPNTYPSRRGIRVLLPKSEPTNTMVAETRTDWSRYASSLEHVSFAIYLDDGTIVQGDDGSLVIEVRLYRPNDWVPIGLSVFGGHVEAEPVNIAGIVESAGFTKMSLTITPVRNPISATLAFDVTLTGPEHARLDFFDLLGRRVARREIDGLVAQRQRVSIDGKLPPAGVYWARLAQGRNQVTARVLLVP